jgi:transitional endoplasmic reticulum ATPase
MGQYDDDEGLLVDVELGPSGSLGRVRHVTGDGRQVSVELRSGQIATATSDEPTELSVDDVVIVHDQMLERAPDELWIEQTWVGVVKIKRPDRTVIDGAGRWQLVPTNEAVEYTVNNTVEVSDSVGVVDVLHPEPIKLVEFGELDESIVQQFKPPDRKRQETFEDFGGLRDVVARAQELIEVQLQQHERLAKINARPIKGVLFTGEPGTGKTMLARIIANRSGATFLEISGPQFISKWVGQSEEILRLIFDYARKEKRCIIFFDEIDSVAGQRSDESHESSRRVVAQLLTLMDGFTPADNVVVIAATNRPQDIDVALLRPGRFDWEIKFPLPGIDDRETILRTSQKQHQVRGELPHRYVAAKTDGWSGAELAAIWTEAALLAVTDERDSIGAEDYLGGYQHVAAQHALHEKSRRLETKQ